MPTDKALYARGAKYPHNMYKGSNLIVAKNEDEHNALEKLGYNHTPPQTKGGAIPKNKALYARVKKQMDETYDKPSAYKSGAIVKKYKELGGTYLEDGKEKKLDRWRRENWVDVADEGQYPVLRPTKRISKDTPLTVKEISTKELNKQIKLKQKLKGDKNLPAFEGGEMVGSAIRTDKLKLLSQSSYKPNKDIKDLTNHKLDRDLSTRETKVWVNPRKKELFIANRGTQGVNDWLNNLSYVTGQYDKTRRYNRAKEIQMKAKNKYPMYKITNIGHSQSAGITRQLNKENLTNEIININPATLYNDRKNKSNEYTIRSKGDLVSIFHSPDKNTIEIKDKTFNPILEHKPRILDRLEPQMIGGNQGLALGVEWNSTGDCRGSPLLDYSYPVYYVEN